MPLQANRRQWAPLVQHCRTHGGDRAYERTGTSLRHGLGVPFEQHEAYLARIGLQPETTAAGRVAMLVAGHSFLHRLHIAVPVPSTSPTDPHPSHAAEAQALSDLPMSREWVGDKPGVAPPLQDPQHAFNSYYAEVGCWPRTVS